MKVPVDQILNLQGMKILDFQDVEDMGFIYQISQRERIQGDYRVLSGELLVKQKGKVLRRLECAFGGD